MLSRYRATGADLPFADPCGAHGVAMEGYFWRLTDERARRTIIAMCAINRDADGREWAFVGLAAQPGGFARYAVVPSAGASPRGLGLWAGDGIVRADAEHLHIELGSDAMLRVRLDGAAGWRRPQAYGALGVAHAIPALGQYWHPHGLGADATGVAVLGGVRVALAGARVYAEKNWSHSGFPDTWWWGQAHSFGGRADVCAAFAGGDVRVGGVPLSATAIVLRIGERIVRFGNPLLAPVRARIDADRWTLRGTSARYTVEIEGHAGAREPHVLPIPLPAERTHVPGSLQHLDASMRVVLRRHGRVLFTGESTLAGLEHGDRTRAEAQLHARGVDGLAFAA